MKIQKTRTLLSILLALILFSTSIFFPNSAKAYIDGYSTIDGLPVYVEPSFDAPITGYLKCNESIAITEILDDWLGFAFHCAHAYVQADFISFSSNNQNFDNSDNFNDFDSSENFDDFNNFDNQQNLTVLFNGYVKVDDLNVRQYPTTDSTSLGKLYHNETVKVVGDDGLWYQIKYNGGIAFVYKEYVSRSQNSQNSSNSENIGNSGTSNNYGNSGTSNNYGNSGNLNVIDTGYVTATSLNVRNLPGGSNSEIIGTLKKGSQVEIVNILKYWYEIKFGASTGYVYKEHISSSQNFQNSSNSENIGNSDTSNNYGNSGNLNVINTGYVTATSLNVRNLPGGSNSEIIGTLKKGSQVEIVANLDSWYEIKFWNGTGYIYKKYVSDHKNNQNSNNSSTSNNSPNYGNSGNLEVIDIGYVTVRFLNVRNSPSGSNSDVIGTLTMGRQVEIVASLIYWYEIKFEGGTGYVYKEHVNCD